MKQRVQSRMDRRRQHRMNMGQDAFVTDIEEKDQRQPAEPESGAGAKVLSPYSSPVRPGEACPRRDDRFRWYHRGDDCPPTVT